MVTDEFEGPAYKVVPKLLCGPVVILCLTVVSFHLVWLTFLEQLKVFICRVNGQRKSVALSTRSDVNAEFRDTKVTSA